MHKLFTGMKRLKKRYVIIIIVVALVAVGWFYSGKKPKVEYTTVKAAKGELIQTVGETGTLKTPEEINLNFLAGGKITRLFVSSGAQVKAGQTLAELDMSKLILKQNEANANLAVAQANLSKTLAGATSHDIEISQASGRQAEAAYLSAKAQYDRIKSSTDETVAQAQKTLDELRSPDNHSANNKRDPLLTAITDKQALAVTALDSANKIFNDEDAKSVLSVQQPEYLVSAKSAHGQAVALLDPAKVSLAAAKTLSSDSNLDQATADCLALLNKTLVTLNYTFSALEKTVVSTSLTQTELDSYKSGISTNLTAISTGISAVQTANQALKDALANALNALNTAKLSADQQQTAARASVDAAYNAWQVAKAQFAKIVAPARSEDIRLAQAQVDQARAALESVTKQIDDNVIRAPIDGIVTKVNYEVGEEPTVAAPVIAMVSRNNYEINLDISETDIVKIKTGQTATITFDAFGDKTIFSGAVTFIEPAQTVIQDVIYYKTTISDILPASSTDPALAENLRPGMTANVVITTAKKDGVIKIPSRAIVENAGREIVRVLLNSQAVEKPVKIGLRGDEGMVEVLSGLAEGEEVITSTKNNSVK